MNCGMEGWFTELDSLERARLRAQNEAKLSGKTLIEADAVHDNIKTDQVIVVPTASQQQMEMGEAWPGQAFSLAVDEVLFDERSPYQHIIIAQTRNYGRMLVLDGVIQCTERDEFMYQEMLTHLPLCSHPCPKKVLIIGGGDGGCVREALKHPSVNSVTLCEIDQMVVTACQKFLPSMSSWLSDDRVTVVIGDGFKYLAGHENEFDVIITDSSDPVGPAAELFGKGYYELIRDALTPNGILASQAESIFLHLPLVKHLLGVAGSLFESVRYANGMVPTYTSGHIGYLICSKAKTDLGVPFCPIDTSLADSMALRYYDQDVHRAAFVLPRFASTVLEPEGLSKINKQT